MIYWGLVIRTNKYAGNFERDLCAHCTGMIGECRVGAEYVDKMNREIFEDIIMYVSDPEDGCSRPCCIYDLVGESGCTSVIIYFNNRPSDEIISIVKEKSSTFIQEVEVYSRHLFKRIQDFEILGFKLVKFVNTEEEIDIE